VGDNEANGGMVLEHLAISGVLVPLHELKKIRLLIFWLKPSTSSANLAGVSLVMVA
jgi:hypothetical protein